MNIMVVLRVCPPRKISQWQWIIVFECPDTTMLLLQMQMIYSVSEPPKKELHCTALIYRYDVVIYNRAQNFLRT